MKFSGPMIQSISGRDAIRGDQQMEPLDQSEANTFRLIITRRNGSEILFSSCESGWTLPRVQAFPRQRIAWQLTEGLEEQLGQQAYCLFLPNFTAPNAPRENYAVLESIKQDDDAPKGTCWMPRTASDCQFDRALGDKEAIEESLRELDSYVSEPKAGPFGRPGWLRELLDWVQEQLSPLGLRVNGSFRQFNASPTFSLIRLETTGPAVWFKATGEPNLHEFPISVSLARLFPEYVPAILGTRPTWNAWLSREVSGQELDQLKEYSGWERVAEALANLQIASIGKRVELLESECKDLRLRKIIGLVDPFLARMADIMASQEKPSPAPLKKSDLCLLGNPLKEACWQLQDLGLPDTLGHIDFSP